VGEQSSQAPWLQYYREALEELSEGGGDETGNQRDLWSRPDPGSSKEMNLKNTFFRFT
jgi:hypothetical protein